VLQAFHYIINYNYLDKHVFLLLLNTINYLYQVVSLYLAEMKV